MKKKIMTEVDKKIKELERCQNMCLRRIDDPLCMNKDYYETQLKYIKMSLDYYKFIWA